MPADLIGVNWVELGEPKQALEFAKEYGPAELDLSRPNWPVLKGKMEGVDYWIEFLGCESPLTKPKSSTLGFRAIIEPACAGLDAKDMAVLNRKTRYAGFVLAPDESGRVVVFFDHIVADGVHPQTVEIIFRVWRTLVSSSPWVGSMANLKECP